MRDLVAERELVLEGVSELRAVRLLIYKPQHVSTDPDEWQCGVQVLGLGDETVYNVSGHDAMQALLLGVRMLSMTIASYRGEGELKWLGGDDLGLEPGPLTGYSGD